MLIVAGTFQIKEEKVAEAIAAMQEMATATQREDGCIHYQFYQDIQEATIFLVYEEWESAEALAAHSQTPHMAVLQGIMPNIVAAPPKVNRYEVKAAG